MTRRIRENRARLKHPPRWRRRNWEHWEDAKHVVEMCGEKRCWTEKEIEPARIEQEQRAGIPLRSYYHAHCRSYHLTKQV